MDDDPPPFANSATERGPLLELLAKKREIALHGVLAVCNGNVEPRKFAEAENLQWWWLVRRRRSRRSGARGSLHGPGCAPVVARFFCLKETPNRNRSGARIPPNTATPFAVHQMLDRNSYVVTGTERAMMLIMVTTAAMMVVERFSFSGRPGESRSPQIQKELSGRRRSSAASDCYAPEAASDCYAPEAASPGLHPPSCVLAPPAGIGGATCAS